MSKQKKQMIKMQADHFEWKLTQKWLDGQHHVDDKIYELFKKKAAEAFMKGDDKLAKLYRDEIPAMLKETFKEVEKYADEHRKTYGTEDQSRIVEFEE